MGEVLSARDQQSMVSSFLEIVAGQTAETARQFLQATNWKLEEAIQLFFVGNEGGKVVATSSSRSPQSENFDAVAGGSSWESEKEIGNGMEQHEGGEMRPPLPVRREILYDDAMYGASNMRFSNKPGSLFAFNNLEVDMKRPGIWESDQGVTSTPDNNLASLYRPPFHLMLHGPFDKAKCAASAQDKWLLVNLQSTKEFSSHMLNRDTWANEAVSQTISTNFFFWQVYDDTIEGQNVYTYYKLDSIPVVLVIDPITGQKMGSWTGMVQPERLLEDLLPLMDGGPKDHHVTLSHKRPRESFLAQPQKNRETSIGADKINDEEEELLQAVAASMESIKDSSGVNSKDKGLVHTEQQEETCPKKKPQYLPLPEEVKGDKNLICRVGVRLPDGRRVQRNFCRSDPIQLLWSFCSAQLPEADRRSFRLKQAIPGASESLDYDTQSTFEESGLANSMISVAWD